MKGVRPEWVVGMGVGGVVRLDRAALPAHQGGCPAAVRFAGSIRTVGSRCLPRRDMGFLLGWSAAFLICRQVPVGELLGRLVIGAMG